MVGTRDNDLLREAQRISYAQRSLFHLRKLRESRFHELVRRVNLLSTDDYDWSDLEKLGISEAAWDRIENRDNSACKLFCHPDVIMGDPELIGYYRGIAGLSAKGIHALAFATENLEVGRGTLSTDMAWQLASTLNSITSHVIENEPEYSTADAILLLHTTVGVSINGSWRNVVGVRAARQVKEVIANHFHAKGTVAALVDKKGQTLGLSEPLPLDRIACLVLDNGYRIGFGSEPDVKTVAPGGEITGVIEVKGGLDPAGALERYGAAKKSFDDALAKDKSTRTMYLAACITPTVRERIDQDRLVHSIFNLTSVLLDEQERHKFLREVEWWVAK